jgi:hypothetical protein
VQWVKNPEQACINGEMSFDAVGTFVKPKAFGLNTGIAGILHGLRVNHQQRCPLGFFLICSRTCPCKTVISARIAPASRHCL